MDQLSATAPNEEVFYLRLSEQFWQTRSEVGQLQFASESSVQIIGCSAAGVCPRRRHCTRSALSPPLPARGRLSSHACL